MKMRYLLIGFITLLVCITEISWHDNYISADGDVLIMGDQILRAVKWLMWGLICKAVLKYKDIEKDKNGIPS